MFNLAGNVNVDVDVDGYYAATGATFTPLAAPVRVTDTRAGTALNGTSIASGGTETFNLTTTASGIPAGSTSVAANFTVVPGAAPGYIQVFPTGQATPTGTAVTSDVNWPASSGPVANFTQANTAGTTVGSVQVYNLNSGSPIDLVIDAFGYFTGGTTAATAAPVALASGAPRRALRQGRCLPTARRPWRSTRPSTTVDGRPHRHDRHWRHGAVHRDARWGWPRPVERLARLRRPPAALVRPRPPTRLRPTPRPRSATCNVTATDSLYGGTGAATITQTPPANNIAVSGDANLPASTATRR